MSRAINTITAATAVDGATNLNIDSGTLFVDTTNNFVGIGTTSPNYKLDVSGLIASKSSQAGIVYSKTNNAADNKTIQNVIDASGNMVWQALTDAGAGGGNSFSLIRSAQQINSIEAQSGGTSWFKIDNSATRVGIGTTSIAAKLNVYDASSATFSLQGDSTTQALVQRASADSSSPAFAFRKTRGSIASPAAVITGDFIGNIEFQAFGGTNNRILSRILGQAEAYVSDTNISSNLVFQTSNVGAATPTEKMRIDSSGNVGIGTTSPAAKLHASTSGASSIDETIRLDNSSNSASNGNKITWRNAGQTTECAFISGIREGSATSFGVAIGTSPNFASGGTNAVERLRIDSSGNVGIGTDSPTIISSNSKILDIVGNSSGGVRFQRTNSTNPSYGYLAALNGYVGLNVQSNSAFLIFTNDTERLRIDSLGNVGIGTPSPDALLHVVNNQNGTATAPQFRISGAASVYEALHYLDATAYYIAQNSGSRELRVYSGTNAALGVKLTVGATSWASISDSRSKDIIEPITNSLDKIQNINPVIGKYKNDELNTRRSFVIGQDVQEVFPESISVDSEGYISVRYSDLIPLLIGGIKELKSENDSLKSRIEALEAV